MIFVLSVAPAAGNSDSDTITFKDIGEQYGAIFISQCVLLCFYGCCLGCLVQTSIMVSAIRRVMSAMGK